MSLSAYLMAHRGAAVWVVGTGPSLDRLDPAELIGRPRIYLNRAAMAFPGEAGKAYWLTLDDGWGCQEPGDWAGLLHRTRTGEAGLIGAWPDRLYRGTGLSDAPRGANIVTWKGPPEDRRFRHQPELVKLSREQLCEADRLLTFCGSAMTAIHLAWVMGAVAIVLAGIDGTDGYAASVRPQYARDQRGGFGYGQSKASALKTAADLKLPVIDLSGNFAPDTVQMLSGPPGWHAYYNHEGYAGPGPFAEVLGDVIALETEPPE